MIVDETRWVWDSWYAHDGSSYHAFFLAAPRALGDPELRHDHATVGHAVSPDLREWTIVPDALGTGEPGAFDDRATWTGSVVRDGDVWRMFYTGISHAGGRARQRIGQAVSSDLITWRRVSADPIVGADARWYSVLDRDGDEPFRDPWVIHHDGRWHMLVTATDRDGVGCIGHATSDDLESWEVHPPLTSQSGFGQLEVVQPVEVDGRWIVVFSTTAADVHRAGLPRQTGTWTVPADSPVGPYWFDRAEPIDAEGVYAGRVVAGPDGWALLGFDNVTEARPFGGVIGDPRLLVATENGTFQPASNTESLSRAVPETRR